MVPSALSARSLLLAIAGIAGVASVGSETHQFDLARNQQQAYPFAVDGPGRINAHVVWRGDPLTVSLIGPSNAQVAQQTGSGQVQLSYVVTQGDVARGSAWRLALQSATRGGIQQIIARGTVVIDHPAGDTTPLLAKATALLNQDKPALRSWTVQAGQRVAAVQRDQLLRFTQMQEQAQEHRRAALLKHVLALRAAAVSTSVRPGRVGTANLRAPLQTPTPTAGPAPVITSLSSTDAQPGDPIPISGSGFGLSPTGATVHAIIAPGRDVVLAAPDYQSDTQIQTSLPRSISGVTDNQHATLYVQTPNGKSQLVVFHFIPATSIVSLGIDRAEVVIDQSAVDADDDWDDTPDATNNMVFHKGGALWGGTGDDYWYRGVQLKNGWTVVGIDPAPQINPNADAYLSVSHVGTADLSFTVHWWTSGGSYCCKPGWVGYRPTITIQGPAGIPFN